MTNPLLSLLFIPLTCVGPSVMALESVTLQEGSFQWSQAENWSGNLLWPLHLERSYSSRSDAGHLLGRGWCSQLEWTLHQVRGDTILELCDKTEVIGHAEMISPGLSIKRKNQRLTFSKSGLLLAIAEEGHTWNINREASGLPRSLASPLSGTSIDLSYTKTERQLALVKSGQHRVQFTYAKGLLKLAKAQTTEAYSYDELDHLNLIENQAWLKVDYDLVNDRVVKTQSPTCEMIYDYSSYESAQILRDQVVIRESCTGKKPMIQTAQFEYEKHGGHAVALKRTSQTSAREP